MDFKRDCSLDPLFSRLWERPKVFLTPHIPGYLREVIPKKKLFTFEDCPKVTWTLALWSNPIGHIDIGHLWVWFRWFTYLLSHLKRTWWNPVVKEAVFSTGSPKMSHFLFLMLLFLTRWYLTKLHFLLGVIIQSANLIWFCCL